MANNSNLHAAKSAKNDEFYTRLEDIEKELGEKAKIAARRGVTAMKWDPFGKSYLDIATENLNLSIKGNQLFSILGD